MTKYRKKPVVIDAKQWWPPTDERHDPEMLSNRKGNRVDHPSYMQVGDLSGFAKYQSMVMKFLCLKLQMEM